jgi:hypothetical protein
MTIHCCARLQTAGIQGIDSTLAFKPAIKGDIDHPLAATTGHTIGWW